MSGAEFLKRRTTTLAAASNLAAVLAALPHGGRTLVVNDDKRALTLIVQTLRLVIGSDVEIVTATTTGSAIDQTIAYDGGFDLTIINYILGHGGTGLEALRWMRRAKLSPAAICILESTAMDHSLRTQARAEGFAGTFHADLLDTQMLTGLLQPLIVKAANSSKKD
jgi:CheY-like chemotaxis protein